MYLLFTLCRLAFRMRLRLVHKKMYEPHFFFFFGTLGDVWCDGGTTCVGVYDASMWKHRAPRESWKLNPQSWWQFETRRSKLEMRLPEIQMEDRHKCVWRKESRKQTLVWSLQGSRCLPVGEGRRRSKFKRKLHTCMDSQLPLLTVDIQSKQLIDTHVKQHLHPSLPRSSLALFALVRRCRHH